MPKLNGGVAKTDSFAYFTTKFPKMTLSQFGLLGGGAIRKINLWLPLEAIRRSHTQSSPNIPKVPQNHFYSGHFWKSSPYSPNKSHPESIGVTFDAKYSEIYPFRTPKMKLSLIYIRFPRLFSTSLFEWLPDSWLALFGFISLTGFLSNCKF